MADGVLNPSISTVHKALCRQELSSPHTGISGDSRGYRVLTPGPLGRYRCSWNAILEGGDEGHLAGAEASCQVPSGPSHNPAVH